MIYSLLIGTTILYEEYVNKVAEGMREEGFPDSYIDEYLFGGNGSFKERILHLLSYIRKEPHAPDVFMLANTAGVKIKDIPRFIDYMTKEGYIRQDRGDTCDKYYSGARYYTVPKKRKEIDRMLEKDKNESLKPFESIDCINSELNDKTKVCMRCFTTHKEDAEFCRKCLGKLENIDTPMLDIIFELNKKGYKTINCCSGHPATDKFYYAYFTVRGNIEGIDAPEGFELKCKNNETKVSSLNLQKGKVKITAAELEEPARRNLGNLRRWVLELPDRG